MIKIRNRMDRNGKLAPLNMNPIKSIFRPALTVREEHEVHKSTEVPCLPEYVPLTAWKIADIDERSTSSPQELFRAKSEPSLRVDEIRPPLPAKEVANANFPRAGLAPSRRTSRANLAESRAERQQEQNDGSNILDYTSSGTSQMQTLVASEQSSYEIASSLPALQINGPLDDEQLDPLAEEDIKPGSFELVVPHKSKGKKYSLEKRSVQLFSTEHLKVIFADSALLLRFTAFLSTHRPSSIPVLVYYLDAVKALKAIAYSNAISEALEPIPRFHFTDKPIKSSNNAQLETRARQAFDVLVREDLPAYITWTYLRTVSASIQMRITGTLPAHLRETSEGLAEVFCLTDPSRPDNPIIFASEEFHRTTQYGMNYVIGRNCRFLQGPKTNPFSVQRIREKIEAGEQHCEVFLNYRRDGSPFMNLLMCAPLHDNRGKLKYFIGAQVDVSGLVKECSDMESLKRVVAAAELREKGNQQDEVAKDEFRELSEMFNAEELETVRKWGGTMHRQPYEETTESHNRGYWPKRRILLQNMDPDSPQESQQQANGKLGGVYDNYLLVRPFPSLRILFASSGLRFPGILQSPFMDRIGGKSHVKDVLIQAMASGRGVTADVRWITKYDPEGRSRWVHCTPLLGSNGAVGVWMIVVVDENSGMSGTRKYLREAPPVEHSHRDQEALYNGDDRTFSLRGDGGSVRSFAAQSGTGRMEGCTNGLGSHYGSNDGRESPYSLRL